MIVAPGRFGVQGPRRLLEVCSLLCCMQPMLINPVSQILNTSSHEKNTCSYVTTHHASVSVSGPPQGYSNALLVMRMSSM